MYYLKKLPERQKSPETCCKSVKENDKFINPWPSAVTREKSSNSVDGKMFFSELFSKYITNSITARETNKKLKVDLNLKAITEYSENDKDIAMQLTWFGHAACLLQINSFTILFDPFLSKRASPINFIGPYRCRDRGFKSFSELPTIDIIILSHDHYDHLDKATIKEIYSEEKNKKAIVFCPLGLKNWFIGIGIPEDQVTECDWWDDNEVSIIPDTVDITDEEALNNALNATDRKIIISAVPSQHFSGRTPFNLGKSLWAGWVVKSKDASYYFAGDTGYRSIPDNCSDEDIKKYPYCPAFKQIGNIHGPFDLASIPLGPFYPVQMLSPIHTTPNDAVNIHIDCKSKHSVAMHWGTVENLGICDIESGPVELHEELKKNNISQEKFHEMYIGEVIRVLKKN
ncbi:Metallo-hydrolase/oxidoreductase [Neocallimastix lanati (nom. inval.)]|jgi:L-ascorbate metabolism protein UlaG (beta-lactamase superfamily)|uniref:Metallo-hydrolase/oxidoreductase n=1 Tax=Neocallimastix californiae TaxID=1754190 RepID=A0A1Y1Z9U1_9FUNG|nr:Metallo-hydrolase/oxidoreductase [Neocallimastix sp. JGI-2020a]ORY07053.1 Metallo-hydrolase/oxidoreductase [Neocallimastix californiae]|eukprot:ORY07053.1 Metallo-hydrolase/oxidoreductase [Neocallimastix californiae]